jgi:hypothetical protein
MSSYRCEYCKDTFTNHQSLAGHTVHCEQNIDNSRCSCEYCGEDFPSKGSLASHQRWCDHNPNSLVEYIPFVCSSNYCQEIGIAQKSYKKFKKKQNHFCCKGCARSYSTQENREEINRKVSNALSGRSMPKDHPLNGVGLLNYVDEDEKNEIISKIRKYNYGLAVCEVCDGKFKHREVDNRQYCSRECYQEIGEIGALGGHGGKGISGYYEGNYYHSSWELAFAVYHHDHKIPFERCWERFSYEWEGEQKTYIPDFKLSAGCYVEVKGYSTDKDEAKWEDFPYDLEVWQSEEMDPILGYVEQEYGKEFWEVLYEED